MAKKLSPPQFKDGQKVLVPIIGGIKYIKGEPEWNGYTYMYSFNDTDARVGEMYIFAEPCQQN